MKLKYTINAVDAKSFAKLMKEKYPTSADLRLQKVIQRALEKEANKLTSKEQEEIKSLQKKALSLWKEIVKLRAEKRCENPPCKKTKRLQAHHVESYSTNKFLRYDPENGVCLCTTDHKFGRHSAHHSFAFMYQFMSKERPESLSYLLTHYKEKKEMTKGNLEFQITFLEGEKDRYQRLCNLSKKELKRRKNEA